LVVVAVRSPSALKVGDVALPGSLFVVGSESSDNALAAEGVVPVVSWMVGLFEGGGLLKGGGLSEDRFVTSEGGGLSLEGGGGGGGGGVSLEDVGLLGVALPPISPPVVGSFNFGGPDLF
jgi:hypothetical protein